MFYSNRTQTKQVWIKDLENVLSTVLSSPDSYQEIEVAITEMESCMKLLFPEFDLTESRLQARECLSADEQLCCCKDLVGDGKEKMTKERQEEENCTEGKTAKDESMTNQEGRRRHNKEAGGKRGQEIKDEEDEEEGHSEDEDESFIRSSGLVSHSYSLDLNISHGGFDA